MAAYPSLSLLASSTPRRDAGMQLERATNGKLRRRRFYTAEKMDFDLVHWLTTAEKVAHEAHYQANKDGSFDFTWPEDGVVRTCGYATCPLPVLDEVAGMWLVTVKLAEV